MKRVVVFRSDLLATSETFILEQVRASSDWSPVLVGYRKVPGGVDPHGVRICILPGLDSNVLRHLWLRLCQWLDIAHGPTVRALRRLNPKLVHAHFGTDAVDIWPSVKSLGIPLLVTLHGYDINIHREWWVAGNGGFRMRRYPQRLRHMAQHPNVRFIAVSRAIKARAVEVGIPEDKIAIAYIGVDTRRFRPGGMPLDQRTKRILFVGRMVEKKAPLLLIRAVAEVRKTVANADLVMIGDGPLLEKARSLAEEIPLPVEFLGARPSDEVLAQLRRARVLCLPSLTAPNGDAEGFGMVLVEAQACGVPVVTSARGGAQEGLLDGVTGYAFTEGSITALTDALRKALSGKGLVPSAAIELARSRFDLRNCTLHLQHIYDEASRRGSVP